MGSLANFTDSELGAELSVLGAHHCQNMTRVMGSEQAPWRLCLLDMVVHPLDLIWTPFNGPTWLGQKLTLFMARRCPMRTLLLSWVEDVMVNDRRVQWMSFFFEIDVIEEACELLLFLCFIFRHNVHVRP